MRYVILVILNLPVILLALMNIVTQYKLQKISTARFRHQFIMWLIILIVLVGSFPVYNLLDGDPILNASKLSAIDIAQTTIIVYLIYIVNDHRRKIEQTEKTIRDLHQEISIKLSKV